ncbi:hypothetical protein [Tengunoibacter tsumagoiensis]|uniref:DUF5655 domain-containing protein n=1 Tax=Tengunoibacter tsumagoiensis TaxID=2014871 RepID=A0A402A2B2_9CHLR|nr:hypothetical protein [Tengunoibacter tsumagoiensis]GCE13196.1 hypothetical protein KTT_30550 [Tengunoibacter tsumagoiensis]
MTRLNKDLTFKGSVQKPETIEITDDLHSQEEAARRQAVRENAKQILRESGLAEMMQSLNRHELKGRGRFEEYDAMVLFKWGTWSTMRHIWIEVVGSSIRFRLQPHRVCKQEVPLCDGEYHTLTSAMWADQELLRHELKKCYDRPVAETSSF